MERTIVSHAHFTYTMHPADAADRARVARSLAARMVKDDPDACIDYCNGADPFEAIRSLAEQIDRIAHYIATGEVRS